MITPLLLLLISNIFMTYAWYGHLKDLPSKPLWVAILVSWGVALLEYCFQVPANRIGFRYYSLTQLKVLQEVITLTVFAGFAYFYMGFRFTQNTLYAGLCLLGAVYFAFRDKPSL
jgi:uncharacterized protein